MVVKRSRPNARVWWKVKWDALPKTTTEHRNNLEEITMQRWVFYANSDWTETELNDLKTVEPPMKHDTDGKLYSFVHVFEAEDWDIAKLQISRLRFGADGGLKPSDTERATRLLRKMPSQAPEGSSNWGLAIGYVLNAFAEAREA